MGNFIRLILLFLQFTMMPCHQWMMERHSIDFVRPFRCLWCHRPYYALEKTSCHDGFGITGKARDWLKSYLTERCQRIKLGDCLSFKADPIWNASRVSSWSSAFYPLYHSSEYHDLWTHYPSPPYMLMIASCMCPWHQATQLQHWMAYNRAWSWTSMNKPNLNPDKTEFLRIGNERQGSKYLSLYPINLPVVETNPAQSARNFKEIFHAFLSHISVVCSSCFTIPGICDILAAT